MLFPCALVHSIRNDMRLMGNGCERFALLFRALSVVGPFLCCHAAVAAAAISLQEGSILTSVSEIRRLSTKEAALPRQVRVKGVVTLQGAGASGGFIIHDGTSGILVAVPLARDRGLLREPHKFESLLKAGTLLEVEGVTAPGPLAPVILPITFRSLGSAPLPEPRITTLPDIWSGEVDCQRIQYDGIVTAIQPVEASDQLDLILMTIQGMIVARFSDADLPDESRLVGAGVRVAGSGVALFNARGEVIGVRVETNDRSDLTILEPSPSDVFAVPEVELDRLRPFAVSADGLRLQRVKVRGVVTAHQPGAFLFLQKDGRGLQVFTDSEERFARGDVVEASGMVNVRLMVDTLEGAAVRKLGTAPIPDPIPVTIARLMSSGGDAIHSAGVEDLDGALVRLEATVVSTFIPSEFESELHVIVRGDESPALARVIMFGDESKTRSLKIRPGARVELTGVASFVYYVGSIPTYRGAKPSNVRLYLDSSGDLVVLKAAPWWTPEKLRLLGWFIAAMSLAVLAWVFSLRLQIRRQAETIQKTASHAGAVEERHRLSRELHDSLEQDLAGIAIQLNAVAARPDAVAPSAREDFERARRMLSHTQTEARNSVWELRSGLMASGGLVGAIRQLCNVAVDNCEVSANVSGEVSPLSDRVEINLLRIAQEAVGNAIRHGKATRIFIELEFAPDTLTLSVSDNGCGFDSESILSRVGHFGLTNMRERARLVSGQFTLKSTPGVGTEIIVTLNPKEKVES